MPMRKAPIRGAAEARNPKSKPKTIRMKRLYQTLRSGFTLCVGSLLLALATGLPAMAQKITVNGTIRDAAGNPVVGASIVDLKNPASGTSSGIDGAFSLSADPQAELEISFIGYRSQRIPLNNRTLLEITLEEDTAQIDEVVVVGYGTMRKNDLTGAIASVGSKQIRDTPVANVGQAIQGKISGVQIVDAGKPGDNVTIKIRGLGTINDSDPLVVIDGVPTDLGLASLNMADIDRIDVLKDASATAIYGARGANGVVMVTTKRGQSGEGRLSVTANWAIQNVTSIPEMLNAAEYAAYSNDMLSAAGLATNPAWSDPSSLGEGTDWLDELFQTGVMQNYTVSYSGGNEKSHYYVSGGFLDQSGTVRTVNYQRFTFQNNNDTQLFRWLKLSNNITFSTDKKSAGSYSISDAMKALPTQSVKDADGSWSGPEGNSYWYGDIRNPIGTLYTNDNQTKGYNFLANISAEVTLFPWLRFKSTFGYDAKMWYNDNFSQAYDYNPLSGYEQVVHLPLGQLLHLRAYVRRQARRKPHGRKLRTVEPHRCLQRHDGRIPLRQRPRIRQRKHDEGYRRFVERLGPALVHGPSELHLRRPVPRDGHLPPRRLLAIRARSPLGQLPLGIRRMANLPRTLVPAGFVRQRPQAPRRIRNHR